MVTIWKEDCNNCMINTSPKMVIATDNKDRFFFISFCGSLSAISTEVILSIK
jgi:hypothetical protein